MVGLWALGILRESITEHCPKPALHNSSTWQPSPTTNIYFREEQWWV